MGLTGNYLEHPEPVKAAPTHPYARLTPDQVIAAVESTGRFSDARILADIMSRLRSEPSLFAEPYAPLPEDE